MSDKQTELLDKIRERVLEREREIRTKEDKEADIQATLQALEEITDVPREEMERIADEIRANYDQSETSAALPASPADSFFDDLPATVREALLKLPNVLQTEFREEYQLRFRHIGISYLLWLIPPPFSSHYLYIRRWFTQALYFVTCGGIFIWWIVDLFRLPELVRENNRNTARKLLKKMLRYPLHRYSRKTGPSA